MIIYSLKRWVGLEGGFGGGGLMSKSFNSRCGCVLVVVGSTCRVSSKRSCSLFG